MRALLRRIARRVLRTYSPHENARARHTESRTSRSPTGSSQTPEPRSSSVAPSQINESVLSDDYFTADEVSFEIERDKRKCNNKRAPSRGGCPATGTPGTTKVSSKKKAPQCDKSTTEVEPNMVAATNQPVSSQKVLVNVTSRSKKTAAQNDNEKLPATQPAPPQKGSVAGITSRSKKTVTQSNVEIPSELSSAITVVNNEVSLRSRKRGQQNRSEQAVNQPANAASRHRKSAVEQNDKRSSELSSTPTCKDSPTNTTLKIENNSTPSTIKKEYSGNTLPVRNQPAALSLTKVAPTKAVSRKRASQISKTLTAAERKDKIPSQQNSQSSSTPTVSTEAVQTKKTAQNKNSKIVAEKIQSHNNKAVTVAASQSCSATPQSVTVKRVVQKKGPSQTQKTAQNDKTAAVVKSDSPVTQISTKEDESTDDPPPTPVVSIVAGHQMGCTGWQLIDEQIPSTVFYRQVARVHAHSVRKIHEYQRTKNRDVKKTQSNAELLKKKRIAASNKRRKLQVRKVSTKK